MMGQYWDKAGKDLLRLHEVSQMQVRKLGQALPDGVPVLRQLMDGREDYQEEGQLPQVPVVQA